MNGISPVHMIVFMVILLLLFAPTAIAFKRRHSYKWLVLLLTFVPVIGWVGALIWSIIGKTDAERKIPDETFK